MGKGSGSNVHVCTTCGKTTTRKGHLCTPIPIEQASLAVCEFCGQTATDPRHVCFPKRVELKYACDTCGRLATTRSLLCAPKALDKPKSPPTRAVGSGKKSGKKKPAAASTGRTAGKRPKKA